MPGRLKAVCTGSKGRKPGNDHELLGTRHSLSVDGSSDDPPPPSCWNLLLHGVSGPEGETIECQSRFRTADGFMRTHMRKWDGLGGGAAMKEGHGEKMVGRVTGWRTPEQAQGSHRRLRAPAVSGRGDYMQFRPGMRFVESMALWPSQFEQGGRQAAHRFVVERVPLFITRARMEHAASIACPDFVAPALIRQAADESSGRLPFWRAGEVHGSDEFRMLLARCLFAGMSDESRMDLFRRSSGGGETGHKQVLGSHEASDAGARDLAGDLEGRMSKCDGRAEPPARLFRNVLLIDDFSASGKPYLRGPNSVAGKIAQFQESINDQREQMPKMADKGGLRVHVLLYTATDRAVDAIRGASRGLLSGMNLAAEAARTIPNGVKLNEDRDSGFRRLVSRDQDKYGRSSPPGRRTREGASEKPYPGFDRCAPPLVLCRNTTNNSLPVLHANKGGFTVLLPRTRRRK